MNLQSLVIDRMNWVRQFTDGVLADFKSPQDWTHQLFTGANHALWFLGHLAIADGFCLGMIAPSQALALPTDYERLFGMGSQPTSDPASYPSADSVRAQVDAVRTALLAAVGSLTEELLAGPPAGGQQDFLPASTAGALLFFAEHEAFHLGQISLVRRALGHKPRF